MAFFRTPLRLVLLLVAACALILPTACDKTNDLDTEELPGDGRPSIRRVAPSQSSLTGTDSVQINFSFTLADDEALKRWAFVVNFDTVMVSDTLVSDTLMGTLLTRNVSYLVPDSGIDIGQCRDFMFRAYVWDNRGQMDSTSFTYQVCQLPSDSCRPALTYQVLDYNTGDSIRNPTFGGNSFRFNLLQRNYATTDAASDIRLMVASNPDSLSLMLTSPNTNPNNVFVVLKAAEFNFTTATWCTMHQAFITHVATAVTPKLEVGDVIILDMALPPTTPNPRQHYAAIEITGIVDAPGFDADFIKFRYKRTSPN